MKRSYTRESQTVSNFIIYKIFITSFLNTIYYCNAKLFYQINALQIFLITTEIVNVVQSKQEYYRLNDRHDMWPGSLNFDQFIIYGCSVAQEEIHKYEHSCSVGHGWLTDSVYSDHKRIATATYATISQLVGTGYHSTHDRQFWGHFPANYLTDKTNPYNTQDKTKKPKQLSSIKPN